MDFDGYEYLGKTVDKPELQKVKEVGNGVEEREKDRYRSSKHRSDDNKHCTDRYQLLFLLLDFLSQAFRSLLLRECLLLKSRLDPNSGSDFDLDIKEDTEEESSKYGKLKHIYVDKNSGGFVYLRFENAKSAISDRRALRGRWCDRKMITATFMVPETYDTKFLKRFRYRPNISRGLRELT